jgi:hypothetical protein
VTTLLISCSSKADGAAVLVTVRGPHRVGLQKKVYTLTLRQGIGTAKALRSKVTSSRYSSTCSSQAGRLVPLGEEVLLLPEAAVLLVPDASSSSAAMLAGVGRVGRIMQMKVITMSMITG